MINFKCPKCGERIEVPDSLAGKSETCPSCGNVASAPSPRSSQPGVAPTVAGGSHKPPDAESAPPPERLSRKTLVSGKRKLILIAYAFGCAAILVIVGVLLPSFSRGDKPVPNIPEKKHSSFQKTLFTEPNYGRTITLISETECELGGGGDIILAEYSREDNRFRLVTRALGQASVKYLEILPDGLRDSSNVAYLLPEPLKTFREHVRIAKEAEAARQLAAQRAAQEEQERQRQREDKQATELKKRLTDSRDVVMQGIRKFLSKGSVFDGTIQGSYVWYGKDKELPFQISLTGDMIIEDDKTRDYNGMSLDQKFEIPAHFHWLEVNLNPHWGDQTITELDGMFFGSIRYVNEAWYVTMRFHKKTLNQKEWWSPEAGSTWDGTKFKGYSKSDITLVRPSTQASPLSANRPTQPTTGPTTRQRDEVSFFGSDIGTANHIVFVIHRSGSMSDSLELVKAELKNSVAKLREVQDFHVILLGDGAVAQENSPRKLVLATKESKEGFRDFIGKILGRGNTIPIPALTRAFDVLDNAGPKPGKIMFLVTNGHLPDNAKTMTLIRDRNKKNDVVVNTILIMDSYVGADQGDAAEFLRKIASENHGTFKQVYPDKWELTPPPTTGPS